MIAGGRIFRPRDFPPQEKYLVFCPANSPKDALIVRLGVSLLKKIVTVSKRGFSNNYLIVRTCYILHRQTCNKISQ